MEITALETRFISVQSIWTPQRATVFWIMLLQGKKKTRNHSYIIKNRNFIKVGTNAALVASSTLILDFTNNFRILPETLKLLLIACSGRISFTFHMCNPSYFKVWANQSCSCCRSQTLPFLVFLVHSLSWFLRNS